VVSDLVKPVNSRLSFITAMSGASGAYHSIVAMRSLDAFTLALNLTSCTAPRDGRLYGNASPPIGLLPVFRLSRSICARSVPHRRCPRPSASAACPLQEYSEVPRFVAFFPRKNPYHRSRVPRQCVRGKMVREFNLILHKKIRISDDLIPIASKDIFLDFARNCWHAAQLVGNKNSNCSLFCCFKI